MYVAQPQITDAIEADKANTENKKAYLDYYHKKVKVVCL